MKLLKRLGANVSELSLRDNSILISYETPVAVCTSDNKVYVTEYKWSRTTSKHITQWLNGRNSTKVPQSVIDDYASGDL